jgi:WhiB family redox-sensing transcriptional regulator
LETDVRWMRRAACFGVDPELFYPERYENARAGRDLCWTCPVQADCLDYALLTREKHGMWGGFSERERRRLRADPAARARAFLRIDHRDAG